jgi:hypothetical protein
MSWIPDEMEKKYISLIASMCIDTLQGKGPEDKQTFLANLKMIRKELKKINKLEEVIT